MDFNQPINQDTAHPTRHVCLLRHVVGVCPVLGLNFTVILEDIVHIVCAISVVALKTSIHRV